MHPLTDILCLTHNKLSVTQGFIEHLFNHTNNFNLIFLDNASTDGTINFLQNGANENKWKLICSNKNLGIIRGRNVLAQHVKSDYFLNIDNDQYPLAGWLESLHNLMSKGYDIVGAEAWSLFAPKTPGAVYISKNIMIPDRGYYPCRRCISITNEYTYIGCGGMLIKKQVYDQIGLFDEQFSPAFFEDPDFSFRAIQHGFKIGWCYDCKINHLSHQTINSQTLFNKSEQFAKSWIRFRDKWNDYFPPLMCMSGTQ